MPFLQSDVARALRTALAWLGKGETLDLITSAASLPVAQRPKVATRTVFDIVSSGMARHAEAVAAGTAPPAGVRAVDAPSGEARVGADAGESAGGGGGAASAARAGAATKQADAVGAGVDDSSPGTPADAAATPAVPGPGVSVEQIVLEG